MQIKSSRPLLYIIESAAPIDVLEGRMEGQALCTALRLAHIEVEYFQVISQLMLSTALARICESVKYKEQRQADCFFVPVIHLSAHGNESGIALTSGEFLSWKSLGNHLYELNAKMGIAADEPARLLIAMSSCKGLYGCQIARPNSKAPFFFMIGPQEDLTWSDSLAGWTAFYHLFLNKGFELEAAINAMNVAAGLEPLRFGIVSGDAIEQRIRTNASGG